MARVRFFSIVDATDVSHEGAFDGRRIRTVRTRVGFLSHVNDADVSLQASFYYRRIIAVRTIVGSFSSVLAHDVIFQLSTPMGREGAIGTGMLFFTRMSLKMTT